MSNLRYPKSEVSQVVVNFPSLGQLHSPHCSSLSFFQNMERLSMLAFHPVKMQSCYEKVEELNLEGLQQRFDVSSPSVFISRAQILMREVRCNNPPL